MKALLTVLALTLAGLCLCACASSALSGEVSGIAFRSTIDRPAVPGGTGYSIGVYMDRLGPNVGSLWVDGVDFGAVERGDSVRVTSEAVVLVNGEPREPVAVPAADAEPSDGIGASSDGSSD